MSHQFTAAEIDAVKARIEDRQIRLAKAIERKKRLAYIAEVRKWCRKHVDPFPIQPMLDEQGQPIPVIP